MPVHFNTWFAVAVPVFKCVSTSALSYASVIPYPASVVGLPVSDEYAPSNNVGQPDNDEYAPCLLYTSPSARD